MKNLTLIAAIGKNGELGYNNKLIWNLKEDLLFFKENTMEKTIVMGRKTFESLPKILPGRKHIVITHQDVKIEGVTIFNSIEDALKHISTLNSEVMIIGGASIYSRFIEYADKMLITKIDDTAIADTFFPEFEANDWNIELLGEAKENGIKYKHFKYVRKKKSD